MNVFTKDIGWVCDNFLQLLPKHECSLEIRHNQNRDYYETVDDYVGSREIVKFASVDALRKACDTNEIWEMIWYPDTPVGNYSIAAPTLAELLEFAAKLEKKL